MIESRFARAIAGCVTVFVTLTVPPAAFGSIFIFQDDSQGFKNMLGGRPDFKANFNNIPVGTDVTGLNLNGATFTSLEGKPGNPGSNTLDIVKANDTFTDPNAAWNYADGKGPTDASTNVLPGGGRNILSPGGAELVPGADPREEDGVQIVFDAPQRAFSITLLYQSLDGSSFSGFNLYTDRNGTEVLVKDGSINFVSGTPAGSPAGSFFFGFISDNPLQYVTRVKFREFDSDNNFPDSNMGFADLRFTQGTQRIPEPGSAALLFLGLGAVTFRGWKNRRS